MKFGVISYRRPVRPGSGVNINIGDPIQELAVLNLYHEFGISAKDICFIDRYHMASYTGEPVILPICCFNQISNMYGYTYDSLPPSRQIIPVYFSFHLHTRILSEQLVQHFKQYEPIGCRDEETMINLRQHGINAYISGCITATFPQRKIQNGETIFCVDVPEQIKPFIPEKLRDKCEFVQHMPSYHRLSNEHYLTDEEMQNILCIAKERLEHYAKDARLIITSRLHAASPCMAMGIPVVVARKNIDGRFSWIDKYTPIYTPEQFGEINWNPSPIQYEEQKEKIKSLFQKLIFHSENGAEDIQELNDYYKNRKRADYNAAIKKYIFKKIQHTTKQEQLKYALWGLTPTTEKVINAISDILPQARLEKVIDRYVEGQYYGIDVEKPETIYETAEELLYIVIPIAAHQDAKEIFKNTNHKYILWMDE